MGVWDFVPLCPGVGCRGWADLGPHAQPASGRWAAGRESLGALRDTTRNAAFISFIPFLSFLFFFSLFPERPNLPRVYLPPRSPLISLKASLCIAAPVQNFERAACDGAAASSPNYSSKILIKKSPAIGCHAGEGRHARPEAAQRPEASPRNIVLD